MRRAGRGLRRAAVVGAAIAVVALGAPSGLANPTFPELDVYTYDQHVGHSTDLSLELQLTPSAATAERATITVPLGYGVTLNMLPGAQLGDVVVDALPDAGGEPATFLGSVVVADPAAFAADPLVQACAPGTHLAGWHLVLSGPSSIVVPIAVDQPTAGGSYLMTVCLDAIHAAGLKPTDVYFLLKGVFQNPAATGTYSWKALMTPLGAAGTPDPTLAFELQGDEPLPETLTLKAQYDVTHGVLTLRGQLLGAGRPRAAIRVHLFAGRSPDHLQEIGAWVTNGLGSYLFSKRLAKKPAYALARVNSYHGTACSQPSTAPAGCAGWSIDGTDSSTTRVVATKPRR